MAAILSADLLQSPALGLLSALETDGFRVVLTDDGVLTIRPRSRLTPERMEAIRAHRDALRALVHFCDDGVLDRREVFAAQLDAAPSGTVPRFLFRSGVAYVKGLCFSCGDRLPGPMFGRCWRCALAWRLACRLLVPAETAAALDQARVA